MSIRWSNILWLVLHAFHFHLQPVSSSWIFTAHMPHLRSGAALPRGPSEGLAGLMRSERGGGDVA